MEEESRNTPTAFVIMPFGQVFDEVYEQLFNVCLTESGFAVRRADDLGDSQNIMGTVVRGINDSDLIVADLTDSNPNVYYELGLAHALNKPTIMATQDIESLPFDLKSYRVIPYGTHFRDFERARNQFRSMVEGILSGEAKFGSPMSDFLQIPVNLIGSQSADSIGGDQPGILDHRIEIEEVSEKLREAILAITEETNQINEMFVNATNDLTFLNAEGTDRQSAQRVQKIIVKFAQGLNRKTKNINLQNEIYAAALERFGTPIEEIMLAQQPRTPEEREKFEQLLSNLEGLENAMRDGIRGTTKMTHALSGMPSIEKTFNRSRSRLLAEYRRLIGNLELTQSIVSRVIDIGRQKLS